MLFQNNLIPKTFPLQVFLGLIQMFQLGLSWFQSFFRSGRVGSHNFQFDFGFLCSGQSFFEQISVTALVFIGVFIHQQITLQRFD